MDRVPNRAKMRREYLWNKGRLLLGFGVVGMLTTLAASTALLILVLILFTLHGRFHGGIYDFVGLLIAVAYFGSFALAGLGGIAVCKRQLNWAREIAYVPPVGKQIAALPIREFLLRGSQASPASPEELLRPAGEQETIVEELLRASAGTEERGDSSQLEQPFGMVPDKK